MAAFPAGLSAAEAGNSPWPVVPDPQTATRGDAGQAGAQQPKDPLLKFAVIGINHGHINAQTNAILRARGELVWLYAKEPELVEAFRKQFPFAKVARSEAEVLEDPSVTLVVSAGIPDERAPLGVRVMQHGKDYMVDKPGITTLEQLAEVRRIQAQTTRIYSIMYSERLENRATVKAGELVKAGAIGRVIQTIGLGPHRMNPKTRPAWFFERARYGGVLCDIASHQADQFLHFTGSTRAEIVAAQVGNLHHPQYPAFEDFGDMLLRGDGGTGYIRVDWFTPDGLSTWKDGRLTILGTAAGLAAARRDQRIDGDRAGRNRAEDIRSYHLEYWDRAWPKDPRLRQIVVQATNPRGRVIQVSILTDDQKSAALGMIRLMFGRWVQENDFKYLDKHFGINQITSYGVTDYEELRQQVQDRQMRSVEVKALAEQRRQKRAAQSRLLLLQSKGEHQATQRHQRIQELEKQPEADRPNKQLVRLRRRRGSGRTDSS